MTRRRVQVLTAEEAEARRLLEAAKAWAAQSRRERARAMAALAIVRVTLKERRVESSRTRLLQRLAKACGVPVTELLE